jgi:ribose transport system permease protein
MGAANAFLIVVVRLAPFIATLAMLGVGTGLSLVFTNGFGIAVPDVVGTIGNQVFGGFLTAPIVVTIVLAVIGGICLHYSRFGRWTFAVGSNREAARDSGIPVGRHLAKIYILSGLLSGMAGVLDLTRLASGAPTSGDNSELNAIAAVVIGGASLFGGIGTMVGSMLGSLVLGVVLSGLVIAGVEPYWQAVVTGLLIAAAVGVQHVTGASRQAS